MVGAHEAADDSTYLCVGQHCLFQPAIMAKWWQGLTMHQTIQGTLGYSFGWYLE